MKPGLYIVVIPSGYNPFVIVGWLRPDPTSDEIGDEYEMLNGRVIRRFGQNAELGVLAHKGPQPDTQLLQPTERECYHRLAWGRAIPCNTEAWAKHIVKPSDW